MIWWPLCSWGTPVLGRHGTAQLRRWIAVVLLTIIYHLWQQAKHPELTATEKLRVFLGDMWRHNLLRGTKCWICRHLRASLLKTFKQGKQMPDASQNPPDITGQARPRIWRDWAAQPGGPSWSDIRNLEFCKTRPWPDHDLSRPFQALYIRTNMTNMFLGRQLCRFQDSAQR